MEKFIASKNAFNFAIICPHGRYLKHMLLAVMGSMTAHSALVAGWDFQTTTTGGTVVLAQPNTPRVYNSNFGSGTIYLDGSNGSSNWLSTQFGGFGGTTVNAGEGFSMATTGASALALIAGSGNSANGKSLVFRFSMDGYEGLTISLAAQRTSTGFASQLWEYSSDGISYRSIGAISAGSVGGTIAGSYAGSGILGFAAMSGLDDIDQAYVRVTFDGATSSSGNNRIDNIQFNAAEIPVLAMSIPEPSCMMLLGAGGALALTCGRRRLN